MHSITIISVGKIKEKYFTDAINEYSKRLGRYCRLNIIELKDEPTIDEPTEREREIILEREGVRIEEALPKSAYKIALCIEGKMQTSLEFSSFIEGVGLNGKSDIVFIIGGSMGICDRIKSMCDYRLSFSKMTFPHQLMRVVLLEQLYRAYNISNGGKYHK